MTIEASVVYGQLMASCRVSLHCEDSHCFWLTCAVPVKFSESFAVRDFPGSKQLMRYNTDCVRTRIRTRYNRHWRLIKARSACCVRHLFWQRSMQHQRDQSVLASGGEVYWDRSSVLEIRCSKCSLSCLITILLGTTFRLKVSTVAKKLLFDSGCLRDGACLSKKFSASIVWSVVFSFFRQQL